MKHRVLIAGSGNITGLNVARALTRFDIKNMTLAGYDFTPHNPTNKLCRNYVVPKCADPEYPSVILKLVKSFEATTIIASNDHDVRALIEMKSRLDEVGVKLNAINPLTSLWLDKKLTSDFFVLNKIETPAQINDHRPPFVVRKARVGERQKYTRIIKSFLQRSEQECWLDEVADESIITEFIDGIEYTIDVFCDMSSNPIAIVPRRRREVRAGIVHFGEVENNELVISESRRVAQLARLTGINCLQCIVSDGKCYFFEINPRPGSGLDLTTEAGVNMPLMWLDMLEGKDVSSPVPDWGLKMVRYHDGYFFK